MRGEGECMEKPKTEREGEHTGKGREGECMGEGREGSDGGNSRVWKLERSGRREELIKNRREVG